MLDTIERLYDEMEGDTDDTKDYRSLLSADIGAVSYGSGLCGQFKQHEVSFWRLSGRTENPGWPPRVFGNAWRSYQCRLYALRHLQTVTCRRTENRIAPNRRHRLLPSLYSYRLSCGAAKHVSQLHKHTRFSESLANIHQFAVYLAIAAYSPWRGALIITTLIRGDAICFNIK